MAIGCYGMSVAFLEDALIAEQTISRGLFSLYEPESKLVASGIENMVLDAQALQHLEVVEAMDGNHKGSLLEYIDHCKTAFGKR